MRRIGGLAEQRMENWTLRAYSRRWTWLEDGKVSLFLMVECDLVPIAYLMILTLAVLFGFFFGSQSNAVFCSLCVPRNWYHLLAIIFLVCLRLL